MLERLNPRHGHHNCSNTETSNCVVVVFFSNSALWNWGCGLSIDVAYTRMFTVCSRNKTRQRKGQCCCWLPLKSVSLLQESFTSFRFLKGEGVMESINDVNIFFCNLVSHAMFTLEVSMVTLWKSLQHSIEWCNTIKIEASNDAIRCNAI